MNHLRRLSMAAVLTMTLTMSVFAGDIPIWGPSTSGSASATIPGQAQASANTGKDSASTASIAEAAFGLLQGMLSLF
ncbi:MAG TPA: hypothetical protein VN643_03335 [Pyrinomonadaceae bacterium]|nr:hypothetical protein [Pyrinomonadaceae bacterium]